MNWLEWTKMVLKTFPNARITETSNGERANAALKAKRAADAA